MNILMVSGDRRILEEGTEAHTRLMLMRGAVERLDVISAAGLASGPRGIFAVLRSVLRTRYDVITAQETSWRGLLAWAAARTTGAKLNLQVHTVIAHESWIKRVLARFLISRADTIRVVSESGRAEAMRLGAHGHVSVLPVFVDIAPFRNLTHHPHQRFKKVILWVGRFEPEKDPLRAFSILKEVRSAGIDAGLIMLGAGSLEKELKRTAAPFPEYVQFPGWQALPPYLAMADLVISTSKFESYGASIIQALAADVPVVAPDVGIAREAGAIIAPREGLEAAVIGALKTRARGDLKLRLPDAQEWARCWKESLA